MSLDLDDPVTALTGVGAKLAGRLAEGLEIHTVRDLLEHYPRTYHDAGEVLDLSEVAAGEPATLIGEVLGWDTRRVPPKGRRRRALDLTTGRVRQASGAVFTVTFFNQRWRSSQLAPGTVAAFSAEVSRFRGQLQLKSPDVQVLGRVAAGIDADEAAQRLAHQRLLAVYPAVDGLPSFKLNELIEQALDQLPPVPEWLPDRIREDHGLIGLDTAVRSIHRPTDLDAADAARRRLVFDELFTLQLGLQHRRAQLEKATVGLDNGPVPTGAAARFIEQLPFALTDAQQQALTGIGEDLGGAWPMHRLLQGDVGSGKTVVALWTMLCAVDRGRQAALMAPTEVLAEQHHRTLTELLAPLGVNVLDGLRVELLTSSTSRTERRRILGELLAGDVDLIVGTHALLEEGVRFDDLGVVVIDEQHRFGVSQRVQLTDKSADTGTGDATTPDVLVMTATPIPRSLALTLYGDLDVTVLDELPPGREPISTQLITPEQRHRRDRLYGFIRSEAAEGRRAYVVCPFVEESGAVPGTAAISEHRRLAEEIFPDLEVALVHGRMTPSAKESAMAAFRHGEAQVLVSTTVIEVGVDVPEATVMVIEDAERYGLSQLHQLRGRVGRGGGRSFCVLFGGWSAPLTDDGRDRLEAVARTTDGFELAEVDLAIRGEGQLFGRAQSGAADLKLARLRDDEPVIVTTRELARAVVASDPELAAGRNAALRAEVARRFGDAE
ncbi:MAG: ATP-dependent DNA helicase RecG, partial [Nitriliruptoraceae bacterium]